MFVSYYPVWEMKIDGGGTNVNLVATIDADAREDERASE
jgi:hypothetical protein